MVLANIDGRDLTDPGFAPVWTEIDKLKLPVLVHPTAPQGVRDLHMNEFGLVPPVGFMVDTTLAFARMIYAGFIDTYPNLKLIASHGGATLPYIAGRLDRCHEMIPACAEVIKDKPSSYLQRIWYDTVVYDQRALDLCISVAGSPDRVLYGSDYPHNIGDMVGCLARVNALKPDTARRVARRSGAPHCWQQRRSAVPTLATGLSIHRNDRSDAVFRAFDAGAMPFAPGILHFGRVAGQNRALLAVACRDFDAALRLA